MNFQLRFLTENFIRLFGISFFDHIVESKPYKKCWLNMKQYDFGVTVWEVKKLLFDTIMIVCFWISDQRIDPTTLVVSMNIRLQPNINHYNNVTIMENMENITSAFRLGCS